MKYDAIIIGGGWYGMAKAIELQEQGLKCALICKGRSIYGFSPERFTAAGGCLLMDEAVSAEMEEGRVKAVFTANLGREPLEAEVFHLATGKFFSGGIRADMDKVYEPVFGLDVAYEPDRDKWFSEKFGDRQKFMEFGVITGQNGCAVKEGKEITNLFPIGEIKAG